MLLYGDLNFRVSYFQSKPASKNHERNSSDKFGFRCLNGYFNNNIGHVMHGKNMESNQTCFSINLGTGQKWVSTEPTHLTMRTGTDHHLLGVK